MDSEPCLSPSQNDERTKFQQIDDAPRTGVVGCNVWMSDETGKVVDPSLGRDNYRPTSQSNPSESGSDPSTEPADPDEVNHQARRDTPLAPPSVELNNIPNMLLMEEDGKQRVPTVYEARETYIAKARASTDSDNRCSRYEDYLHGTYPRILEADRQLRQRYEGLTTVMLTRRLSPLDNDDNWLTPWELVEMLHGGGIRRSVRRSLDYHLSEFEFEYVGVTAPTRSAATPHEHTYLWVDDPRDEISTEHIEPALERHLERCPNAYEKHHQYMADGTGGSITIQHDPDLIDHVPEGFFDIVDDSVAAANDETLPLNTAGAQYLASQLVHLQLGNFYNESKEDPPDALLEGAAIAWATSHRWFTTSVGVPRLEKADCS